MCFVEEEGIASSFQGMAEVIEGWGLPSSLYTDRGSHYWTTPEAGGKVDRDHRTQFGRAMRQLGVEMIPAYSPQARGRCERMFATHQERLPKELAAQGIDTMPEANRYLAEHYRAAFNEAGLLTDAVLSGTARRHFRASGATQEIPMRKQLSAALAGLAMVTLALVLSPSLALAGEEEDCRLRTALCTVELGKGVISVDIRDSLYGLDGEFRTGDAPAAQLVDIVFRASPNPTFKMTGRGIELDMIDACVAIFRTGIPIQQASIEAHISRPT